MRTQPAGRVALLTAVLVATAVARARQASLSWGASDNEVGAPLPGDDRVARADLQATRAVTVDAPPEAVWPWLAQLGQGRGGLYSYDALENLVGCDMHSADEVLSEHQDIAVGDQVRLHPELPLDVVLVEPGRALVLQGGVPLSGAGTPDAAPPYDFSWAFVLVPAGDGATRLVVRERYGYTQAWSALVVEPVEWVSFLMSVRMLRGIKERAERHHARRMTP